MRGRSGRSAPAATDESLQAHRPDFVTASVYSASLRVVALDQGGEFLVGTDVALGEGAAGDCGEPHREGGEVFGVVVACVFGQPCELVERTELLRSLVRASCHARIRSSSSWISLSGTPWAVSTVASCVGNRVMRVAAGASGRRTGRSVRSLMSSAIWCGFQDRAVAYQSPSRVVLGSRSEDSGPRRSRSFRVARMVNTPTSSPRVWSPGQ